MAKRENSDGVPFRPSAKTKKDTQRIAVSVIFIIMGVSSFLNIFDALKALFGGDTSSVTTTVFTAVIGLLMLLAGIFALFRTQRKTRVWIGILIFIVALVSLVLSIISRSGLQAFSVALMQCAISWLFIITD